MENNTPTIEERQEKDKQTLVDTLKEMPIIQVACKRSGLSRATYYRWRKDDPGFFRQSEDAIIQGIEFINDMSESQLITLIREKKMPAIAMWLRNNNKRYGAKPQLKSQATHLESLSPSDPRYPQYQKYTNELKKVAEKYEEELRVTITKEIHGKHN